jgi:DUF2971 family protein
MSKKGRHGRKVIKRNRRNDPLRVESDVGTSFEMFHYTTASGLIGILESGSLWATHANFLNDSAECQLLNRLLTPLIKSEFEKIVPELTSRGAFIPDIMNSLGGDAMSTEAEKVTNSILRAIDRVSPIYITSFCMHEANSPECNHGLLSQWRGYGKGGFAIEFDESALDNLTKIEAQRCSYQAMMTRKVEYDNHVDAANLNSFAGIANAALKVAFEQAAPTLAARADVANILRSNDLTDYVGAFINALPFLKSPRFKEENEYRIVALPTRSRDLIEESGSVLSWKETHFREGAIGSVVPFIRLFKDIGARLPIKKVIVGPHRDQKNQTLAATLLLEKFGFNVPVVSSDTTLRF